MDTNYKLQNMDRVGMLRRVAYMLHRASVLVQSSIWIEWECCSEYTIMLQRTA